MIRPSSHRLLIALALVVSVVGFMLTSSSAYADDEGTYRGCYTNTLCNGTSGMCQFRNSGGNGNCACFDIGAPYGYTDTCACSTGQYAPCGGDDGGDDGGELLE